MLAEIMGRPMLELLIERVKRSKSLDQIVVATTEKSEDDRIVQTVEKTGVGVFRGSENDVLDRIIKAGEKYGGEIVVRLTGDNLLVDPFYIDEGVNIFLTGKYDYVGNTNVKLTMPRGFDVEVVALKKLKELAESVKDPIVHEHVTAYFYQHPKKFKLKAFGPVNKEDVSGLHLAVDTKKDLELVKQIFERLYRKNPIFGYAEVINLLNSEPKLKAVSEISSLEWRENSKRFFPNSRPGNENRL